MSQRPPWALAGAWATWCGALASNRFRLEGEALLTLALVLLLVVLAWDSLWELVTGRNWFAILAAGWPPRHSASFPPLPFTQPASLGGRLGRQLNLVAGWWADTFWPIAGEALLSFVSVSLLAAVLTVLLPARSRLLMAGVVVLLGVGVVQRRRGSASLAGRVLLLVGGGWLAGHLAFAQLGWASVSLAFLFSLSAWGVLSIAQGMPVGGWSLTGGHVAAGVVMVLVHQPLAAGAMGLFLFGLFALQLALRLGGDAVPLARRMGLWLMAAMLLAAWALP